MPGYASRYTRICVMFALTSAVMCTDTDVPVEPVVSEQQYVVDQEIRYHLDWDWGDAEPTDKGWRVTTDRGYDVQVTEGFLITYSVQLAPCADDDLGYTIDPRRLFGVGHAWAGHGGPEDPSAWLMGIAENLAAPEHVSLAPISLSSGIYCRAHYLVSRADTKTRGLPEDFNMVGTSLYLQGTAALDGGEPQPFSIWSTLPVGELVAWSEPVSPVDLSDGTIDVTFTRDLGRLFDGVAFQTMSDESIEKTVLLGLIERLSVTLGAP